MVAQMMCVWCWSIRIKETWVGGVACSRLQHLLESSVNPAPVCVFPPRFIFISSTLLKISHEPVPECWELIPSQRISKKCNSVITLFPLYFLSDLTWTSFEKCPLGKLAHRSDIDLPCQVFPIILESKSSTFLLVKFVAWQIYTGTKCILTSLSLRPLPSPSFSHNCVCLLCDLLSLTRVVCDLCLELSMGTWSNLRALG